jgi:hypothetical protein
MMEMEIMVPAPAVWVAVLALAGPLTYGLIWAFKDLTRWVGRRWLGWTADPNWNGVLRLMSIAIGASMGFGFYYFLASNQWPWGVGIGGLAGLLNIGLFKVAKQMTAQKVKAVIAALPLHGTPNE